MNDGLISQEEIDALLNKSGAKSKSGLSENEIDIIGEVGNISMSTAATTLSEILNKKVNITTPKVSCERFGDIIDSINSPKLVAVVSFKKGLTGNNLFMVNMEDAAIIADLMMGGEGNVESTEMTELQQSAVAEAMNQMIGSASTAMATMVGRGVDINPPTVILWDDNEREIEGMDSDQQICKIEFDLIVEGLIESKIMQFFERDTIVEIIDGISEEDASNKEKEKQKKAQSNSRADEAKGAESNSNKAEKNRETLAQRPIFNDIAPSNQSHNQPRNLDMIMDVPLEFSVVLGRSKKTIKDILSFGSGSVIELNKQADEALEIYVNGKLIAQGEVVVINENFGIRITHILSKEQRIKGL